MNSVVNKNSAAFVAFLQEVAASGALARATKDGFDLYLRFFDLAQDIRQALPEWSASTPDAVDLGGISVIWHVEFNRVKAFFVDVYEFLSRVLTFVTALENIEARGDHNSYLRHPQARFRKFKPTSMKHFSELSHAPKKGMVTSHLGKLIGTALEPKLRNGVGHYTAHFVEEAGTIQFSDGMGVAEEITYGSFLLRTLRLMLRVMEANQLLKVLNVTASGAGIDVVG